jgi:DNA-binding NtrC family response regulator
MSGNELVLLDMPNSVEALREIKSYCPDATVLVAADPEQASLAFDDGAYHFLKKPIKSHELKSAVNNALQSISMRTKLEQLKSFGIPKHIIGAGKTMKEVIRQIERTAARDVPVLIVGEQGTGKMVVADTIHRMSSRRLGKLVFEDCSNKKVIERLQGNNDAQSSIASADGGIVVLKDLHRQDADGQSCIAEHIKNGLPTFDGMSTDVRVMATTANYSKGWPLSGHFRSIINLPPLRQRKEDILALANQFALGAATLLGGKRKEFSPEAIKTLKALDWPGNISELKSTVQRAYLLCRDTVIEPCHISTDDGSTFCSIKDFLDAKLSKHVKNIIRVGDTGLYASVMDEVEKTLIDLVLKETGGNQVKASNALGITRTTLRTKIKNYGLNGSSKGKNQ